MKRLLIPFAILALGFTREGGKVDINYFRKEFPLVKLRAADTLHFYPYEFIQGTYDSAYAKYFYQNLVNPDSGYYSFEYSTECFFRPILRGKMNGVEIYVGEWGDTNRLSIYYGKDVLLYTYDKDAGFTETCLLAMEHAGEGPWFQTDSWFTDINNDGKIDILTREVGEYMQHADGNGEDEWNHVTVDELSAVTLVDTGLVKVKLSNPDSLRNIYVNEL